MKIFLSLLLLCNVIHLDGMKRSRKQNQKQLYVCMCGKEYKTKGPFTTHQQENKKYSICILCKQNFNLSCCFKHHLVSKHKLNLYLCLICNRELKTERTLKDHIKKYHSELTATFLPISLIDHIQNNHQQPPLPVLQSPLINPAPTVNPIPIDPKQFYTCGCGGQYVKRSMFEKHINENTRDSVCVDPSCNQKFDLMCCFHSHMRSVHDIKSYIMCPLCPREITRKFRLKPDLTTHIRTDHPKPIDPVSLDQIPANPVPVDPRFTTNLESLLCTNNPFNIPQPCLDNSLFLEWTHNT